MLVRWMWLVVVAVLCCPGVLLGQTQAQAPPAAPAADDVTARINQLEAETRALRGEVEWLRENPARLPPVSATPTGMVPPPESGQAPPPAEVGALREEMKKMAWKKGDFSITPYGWLWGNAVVSTERTNPGSYTLFVTSPTVNTAGPESEFIVDARNTRLGFDVLGPEIPFFYCARGGGKVEIDFQNAALTTGSVPLTENKPTVLLRHAYLEEKDDQQRFLVGQTWDVISPLYPGMLMYSVGWDGGNIGYRRAQVRDERYYALSDTSLLTAQISINQDIFGDNLATGTTITGKPANWPIVEGRMAWTLGPRGQGCLPMTFGASGHIGEVDFFDSVIGAGPDQRRRTWSGNVDIRIPITERFGFQGEAYVGENLSGFFGGIGQGINPVTGNTIRDSGGWLEFWYDWTCALHSHVGYSVDDPIDVDVAAGGNTAGRTYNQFYFGNLTYDFTKNFLVGLEVSSWKTLYVGQDPGDSVRCEFVAKYGF